MATALGGNNNPAGTVQSSLSATSSATITVVATGTGNPATILQHVTPAVVTVQGRDTSSDTAHSISITAVAAAHQAALQQNGGTDSS